MGRYPSSASAINTAASSLGQGGAASDGSSSPAVSSAQGPAPTDAEHFDLEYQADVLIVGSGPVGAAFARRLLDNGRRRILMLDIGRSNSRYPGEHLKNCVLFQRDVGGMTGIITGHLQKSSVPTTRVGVSVDNVSWRQRTTNGDVLGFVKNGQNPRQDPWTNLAANATTYCVGGMATHWTCAIPRQHREMEANKMFTQEEMSDLYDDAEQYFNVHDDIADIDVRGRKLTSMKHAMVYETLEDWLAPAIPSDDHDAANRTGQVGHLPLAGERINNDIVWWSAADTILKGARGDVLKEAFDVDMKPPAGPSDPFLFKLLEEHRCTKLFWREEAGGSHSVEYCDAKNLRTGQRIKITAKAYIVCANATLTPQILWNSDLETKLPALGRYLCEQPMAFCQIVLKEELVERYTKGHRYAPLVAEHKRKNPRDPVPIPFDTPEPQVWIPVSKGRPWHCQIHRDAFSYGGLADEVDGRLIVDLRWFGMMSPESRNRVTFERDVRDRFGMPQPTFDVTINDADAKDHHDMMTDMNLAAASLGGFLPGGEPRFVTPGLTLHVSGTTRMGVSVDTSVVNKESRVHNFSNLFLGGNGVHPERNACNPTVTSVAYAIYSADWISSHLLVPDA